MTTAQWRTLTYVLAVVFLLVVGLLVVIILSRIGDDGGTGSTSTPTPTALASASSSPSGAAISVRGTIGISNDRGIALGRCEPDRDRGRPTGSCRDPRARRR